jgi:hypothetical protein
MAGAALKVFGMTAVQQLRLGFGNVLPGSALLCSLGLATRHPLFLFPA